MGKRLDKFFNLYIILYITVLDKIRLFLQGGKNMFTLSENELNIVSLMWEENRPLSRTEIIELATNKKWKPSSIHILLNSLLNKKAIEVDGFVKTGKNFGRTYIAAITEEEYFSMQFKKDISSPAMKKAGIPKLFSALIDTDTVDADTLDDLQKILNQKKEELPK